MRRSSTSRCGCRGQLIVEHPLRSLTTNIRGRSEIVIEAAHRYRRKILLASTSEIYGKNSSGPLHEESERILGSPAVVRWAYSTAKAVDEILANAYHKERGLPTIVLRLFNTVDPPEPGIWHGYSAANSTGFARRASDGLR